MKFYNVTVRGVVYESFGVEANNESQAIEYAKEDFKARFSDNIENENEIEVEDFCQEG